MSSGDDEQLRRIRVAAEDLADQPEPDRSFFLPRRAEEIGVTESVLKKAVHGVLQERAKRAVAVRLEQDRERKRQEEQRLAERRELDRRRKQEARERKEAKQAEEREQQRRAKEAERDRQRHAKEASARGRKRNG